MASALGQLTLSRLRQSLREPETIFWTFLFPALLAAALGLAFRGQGPDPAEIVIVAGEGARDTARRLSAEPLLRVRIAERGEAERRLRNGLAAVVVAPGDPVVYRYDPSRAEANLARASADRALQMAAGRRDPLAVRDERVDQVGARYIDFLIPGLLGMNLMGGGLWGIGWGLVEMRTRRLLKRLLATPMRRRDLLLSLILARLVFVPLEVLVLLGLGALLFGVSVAGSLLDLALVVLLGAVAFAGLGTMLASRAKTSETISGLINLCTLPMFVLSGVFFAASRFPEALQPFIQALPLTALVNCLRGVMNEGTPLLALWPGLLVLSAWGLTSFVVALRLFRWRE